MATTASPKAREARRTQQYHTLTPAGRTSTLRRVLPLVCAQDHTVHAQTCPNHRRLWLGAHTPACSVLGARVTPRRKELGQSLLPFDRGTWSRLVPVERVPSAMEWLSRHGMLALQLRFRPPGWCASTRAGPTHLVLTARPRSRRSPSSSTRPSTSSAPSTGPTASCGSFNGGAGHHWKAPGPAHWRTGGRHTGCGGRGSRSPVA